MAVMGAQGDAVVVGVVRTVVEVVVEGVFVRVVVQVFDGLAFAGDEADAVFSGVEIEDLVQRRAVRAFQRIGDEDELVRAFSAYEAVCAACCYQHVIAQGADEVVLGFGGVEGEGVAAAFAEDVEDVRSAFAYQLGVVGVFDVRGDDGRARAAADGDEAVVEFGAVVGVVVGVDGGICAVFLSAFDPVGGDVLSVVGGDVVSCNGKAGFGRVAVAVDADDGFVDVAVDVEGVVAHVVVLGVTQYLQDFGNAVARLADGDAVVGDGDAAAQFAVAIALLDVDGHGTGGNAADVGGVAADVDGAAARAFAALPSSVVDDADEVFAAVAADVVVGDVQGVIHVALVVSVFDGVGVDVVLIDGEVFDGVAADGVLAVLAAEVAELGVGLDLDAGVAVVGDFAAVIAVVFGQAEVGVGADGVVADGDVGHAEAAVIDGDAVQAVAVASVVFDEDVFAVVDVEAFAVVVVGVVVPVGDADVVAARHAGRAVAGAAVGFVAVPGEFVSCDGDVFLVGEEDAGDAVVVQVAVDDLVVAAAWCAVFVKFAAREAVVRVFGDGFG